MHDPKPDEHYEEVVGVAESLPAPFLDPVLGAEGNRWGGGEDHQPRDQDLGEKGAADVLLRHGNLPAHPLLVTEQAKMYEEENDREDELNPGPHREPLMVPDQVLEGDHRPSPAELPELTECVVA